MTILIIGVLASSFIGFITGLALAADRIENLQRENDVLKNKLTKRGTFSLGENTIIENAQILVNNYLGLKS